MPEIVAFLFKFPIFFIPLFISSIFMLKYGFKEIADMNHRDGDDIPNWGLKAFCGAIGFALIIASFVGFFMSISIG